MRRQVAAIKPCSCLLDKKLAKYTANESFTYEQKQHTFQNAVIDTKNAKHFVKAKDFIRDIEQHQKEGTWMYLFGDETRTEGNQSAYGTGKTYLMECMANELVANKIPAIFITEETLFGDIKSTYSKDGVETESEVLNRYFNVPVLMIDDIFTSSYKDWAEGKLYSILNERLDKITIMTSNYATGRIQERMPINGRKIASRIVGQSMMLEMIGPDRRERKARERRDQQ